MKMLKNIILVVVITVSFNFASAMTEQSPTLIQELEALSSNGSLDNACNALRSKSISILSGTQGAFIQLARFKQQSGSIFTKWPQVVKDFMETITQIMPIQDIKALIAKLGLNEEAIANVQSENRKDSEAENAQKDILITAILKNSPLALKNMFFVGIGYVASYLWPASKSAQEKETEKTAKTEAMLNEALRIALRRNYSVGELTVLKTFSETPAFKKLMDHFDDLKQEFLSNCPELIEILVRHLMTFLDAESNDTITPDSSTIIVLDTAEGAKVEAIA